MLNFKQQAWRATHPKSRQLYIFEPWWCCEERLWKWMGIVTVQSWDQYASWPSWGSNTLGSGRCGCWWLCLGVGVVARTLSLSEHSQPLANVSPIFSQRDNQPLPLPPSHKTFCISFSFHIETTTIPFLHYSSSHPHHDHDSSISQSQYNYYLIPSPFHQYLPIPTSELGAVFDIASKPRVTAVLTRTKYTGWKHFQHWTGYKILEESKCTRKLSHTTPVSFSGSFLPLSHQQNTTTLLYSLSQHHQQPLREVWGLYFARSGSVWCVFLFVFLSVCPFITHT